MMLRSLHRSSTAASSQALWLGVICQLRQDISCVASCGRSLADQPLGNSPACALPLATHQTCQRSLSGVAVHPDDEQTYSSDITASDSLPQRAPRPWSGAAVSPAYALHAPLSGACIASFCARLAQALIADAALGARIISSRLVSLAACCAGAASSADDAAAIEPAPERRLLQTALVGAPNAGKSSLANALAGRKIAAVSHRTNTTAACRLAAFTDGAGTQVRVRHSC